MKIKEFAQRIKSGKIAGLANRVFGSYLFPAATAVLLLFTYYTGWDLLAIWYIGICAAAILIFCDDITPFFCVVLFLNAMISKVHSPAEYIQSDYFSRPLVIGIGIIPIIFCAVALVARFVLGIMRGKFKPTLTFWCLLGFCVALIFNGLFYSSYTARNLLFGLVLAFVFLFGYVFACSNIKITEKTFKQIATYLIALALLASAELAVSYSVYGDAINHDRPLLNTGWGTYNQIGLLMLMALPAWFYLAKQYSCGGLFLVGAAVNMLGIYFSVSRQALMMSAVIFLAGMIWLIVTSKGRSRKLYGLILGAVCVAFAIACGVKHEKVGEILYETFTGGGSGRMTLWKQGIVNFLGNPAFGIGFYDPQAIDPGFRQVGYYEEGAFSFNPFMCHNTILQLMSACGIVGLAAYLIHRVQTAISLAQKPTPERIFVSGVALAILLTSLLDNHIFYIVPTLAYDFLLAYLTVTEKKKEAPVTLFIHPRSEEGGEPAEQNE